MVKSRNLVGIHRIGCHHSVHQFDPASLFVAPHSRRVPMSDVSSMISVDVRHVTPSDPALPALAVQVTKLVESYMLWVGVLEEGVGPDEVEKVPLQGSLARDWACAMPTANVRPRPLWLTVDNK
jgi:hypothetical protein